MFEKLKKIAEETNRGNGGKGSQKTGGRWFGRSNGKIP